jgi:hypothetical protein
MLHCLLPAGGRPRSLTPADMHHRSCNNNDDDDDDKLKAARFGQQG